jgi:probable addiction module antidote protein
MTTETLPFDAAQYLTSPKAQAELLVDAFDAGDAGYIAAALGTVARARGMTTIAERAGVTREALYKSLTPEGDPRLSTLLGVMKALGLKLEIRGENPAPIRRRRVRVASSTKPRLRLTA